MPYCGLQGWAPMADVITGPSGGVLGRHGGMVSLEILEKHPDLARAFVTTGKYPRAGHDRARWETVRWDEYRAQVGIGGRSGPWRIWAHEARDGDPGSIVTAWVADAEGMPPTPPGVYAELLHDERGLVMSDVPAEIAGALPFLDFAERLPRGRVLIAGLGLGIIPARLLAYGDIARIDVIEIDVGVISLVTGGCRERWAPNAWAADPRLHVHQADAHTWWPGALSAPLSRSRRGCALHDDCTLWVNSTYHAGWFDIWDVVSPHNLPSMRRLTRHFARRVFRMWSWERPECEAMLARGQVLERPCWIDETGYPAAGEEAGDGG
jgi:hypothetical protein